MNLKINLGAHVVVMITEGISLRNILYEENLTFERLYRIELQKKTTSTARGGYPEVCWETVVLFNDLQDRTLLEISDEIIEYLRAIEMSDSYRFIFIYWAGDMMAPQGQRLMGRGESFLFDPNKYGMFLKSLSVEI